MTSLLWILLFSLVLIYSFPYASPQRPSSGQRQVSKVSKGEGDAVGKEFPVEQVSGGIPLQPGHEEAGQPCADDKKAVRKAKRKERRQSPEEKARRKADQQTPEKKAAGKAKRQTPEAIAKRNANRQTPEAIAKRNANRQTPEAKAKRKANRQTPEAKAKRKANRQARRKGLRDQGRCRVGRRQDGFQDTLCLTGSPRRRRSDPKCPSPCRVDLNGQEIQSSGNKWKLSTCSGTEDCKFGPFERTLRNGSLVHAFYCVSLGDIDTGKCPDDYENLVEKVAESQRPEVAVGLSTDITEWPVPCRMTSKGSDAEVWRADCPVDHTCSAIPFPVCVNGEARKVMFCKPNGLPDEIDCDCETEQVTSEGSIVDIVN